MKKNLLVFTLFCFFTFQSRGQYASSWVGFPPAYELSSGFTTQNTPGYFWLGYLSSVQNISTTWHVNKNFCIMGSGSSSIWAAYKIYDANACSGSLSQVLNGYGVSAIETVGPNYERYALAGVYDKACYFTTLDKFGNVVSAISYPFPYQLNTSLSALAAQFSSPLKPILVESDIPGEYYICGNFDSKMYVIHVNSTGAILWSSFYSVGMDVKPKDIMMNPYQKGQLIIVGETSLSPIDNQGFLMNIDGVSGQVVTTRVFGDPTANEGFGSIIQGASISPSNGAGLVIGGYSKALGATSADAWVLKLDQTGNILWSNLLNPSLGNNMGVIDIVERLNTFNNYEYYALLNSSVGMQVLKLDDKGYPFQTSSPNALYNEFVYDLPALNSSKATSISYVNSPAYSVDMGIQVYGTASNFTGFSSSYVVSAYFNGETNCYRTLTTMQGLNRGPVFNTGLWVNQSSGFVACTNFAVVAFFPGGAINYPCSGLMASGSNQRSMPSGISMETNDEENFSVYPNPVSDKTQVSYSASDNSEVSIDLYSLLGQHLAHIQPEAKLAGTYKEEIDFSSLDLQSGVYFVTTIVDGKSHKQKILYTR